MTKWRLVCYVNKNGRVPVKEFLDALTVDDPDRYAYFEDVLLPAFQEFGPGVGMPHFKRLPPSSFAEIRWNGKDRARYRIYCSIETGARLTLYHGVVKRWQKFDKIDRDICDDRYTDYHNKNYDAQKRLQQRA